MTTVDVQCLPTADGTACAVVVRDARGEGRYSVTVTDDTFGDHERLVRETFDFLLEREPRESILSSFDLSVVRRYFPDYDDEIRRRMAGAAR